MEFTEKWGTDVDTAVQLALEDLKCGIDEVEVKVIEEPSRGFFGIGSKLAFVRVEKKKQELPKEDIVEKSSVEKEKIEAKPTKKENVKTHVKAENSVNLKEKKASEKTASGEVIKNIPEEKAVTLTAEERVKAESLAIPFLTEVSEKMGLSLSFVPEEKDDCIFINISGNDTGTIIGKRGATLDAIQYLTSLVVNKEDGEYIRVVLDAENYRSKREKTLEALAKRLSSKVVKTGRSVKLEPMNPYERKIIHSTLQNNPRVITKSEGQDPYRRVVIELK